MKPRLTQKVRRGLMLIANVVDAGSAEDLLGYSEEQMARMEGGAELQQQWADACAAVRWMQANGGSHA